MSLDHQEPITPLNINQGEDQVTQSSTQGPIEHEETVTAIVPSHIHEQPTQPESTSLAAEQERKKFSQRLSTKVGTAVTVAALGAGVALGITELGGKQSKGDAERPSGTTPTATASARPSQSTSPTKSTAPGVSSIPTPEAFSTVAAGAVEDATGATLTIEAGATPLLVEATGANTQLNEDVVRQWIKNYFSLYQRDVYTTDPYGHVNSLPDIMASAKALLTPNVWSQIASATDTHSTEGSNQSIFNVMQSLVTSQTMDEGYKINFTLDGQITLDTTANSAHAQGVRQGSGGRASDTTPHDFTIDVVFKKANYVKADGTTTQVWLADGVGINQLS